MRRSYFFFAAFILPDPHEDLPLFAGFLDMHVAIFPTPFQQPPLSPQASHLTSPERSIHVTCRSVEMQARYP